METSFMNTGNSKTNEPQKFRFSLSDKVNFKNPNKNITSGIYYLLQSSIYYALENIKSAFNNNKFKSPAPTWNDTFDLSDGSYCIEDIQGYFEFIIKKHVNLWKSSDTNLSQ